MASALEQRPAIFCSLRSTISSAMRTTNIEFRFFCGVEGVNGISFRGEGGSICEFCAPNLRVHDDPRRRDGPRLPNRIAQCAKSSNQMVKTEVGNSVQRTWHGLDHVPEGVRDSEGRTSIECEPSKTLASMLETRRCVKER